MSDESARKRPYDDRVNRLLKLAQGLMDLGARPRRLELDGISVEVDFPSPVSEASRESQASSETHASVEAGGQATHMEESLPDEDALPLTQFVRTPVRSYRQRAQEDLRRRIDEERS